MENPITETRRKPSIKCNLSSNEQIVYMLAKAGWWNSSPSAIFNAPIDEVINAYHYEIFTREYEQTYFELNKETQK